ncbi:MAG: APC family permease [Verrucomicrobia bacterium]|nr:APC family permease [Verrucomicrobiota bacterium]
MPAQPAQLNHNALSLRDVVFQGITHIAPAVNVVFTLPVIAAHAGAAMPLSLLLSVVVCFLIANTVAQFSRYVPSSGGYYTFVSRGLGPRWGFLTTWSYLIYEVVGPAAPIGILGLATAGFVKAGIGYDIPWWIFSVAMSVVVWILTYRSVRLSAHTTAILGAVEILILLALGVTFLIYPADGSSMTAPLDPSSAPKKWGVLGGMVFSILALSGFEAPAPLAEESKRPTRFIYLAIFLSLVIVGVFYVFMAYSSAVGWGTANLAGFVNEDSYYTLVKKVWGNGWWLVFFALINCTLALGVSGTNAATRVIYTMALARTLPAPLKKIHPVHRTPYVAVHVFQILQIACFLLVGVCLGPGTIFPFIGTIGSLAVIVLYMLANVALTLFVWQRHRPDFSIWRHGVVPAMGTLMLIPVVVITVWEFPENLLNFSQWAVQKPPFNLAPYCFVALMILGLAVMWVLQARRPEALKRDLSQVSE